MTRTAGMRYYYLHNPKSKLVDMNDEVSNEFEYYDKIWNFGRRKVLKYEYHVFVYINGILQQNSNFDLSESDQIEVFYKFVECGKSISYSSGEAEHADYMSFLHEAYKLDSMGLDMSYIGTWLNNQ